MSPTRRDFLVTSALASAGVALARPSRLWAWAQQQPQPVFTPLRGGVGTFTMRGGTMGWMVNEGGVVVVDAQYPAEANILIAGLKERSHDRPVDFLFDTHHHGDHTSGNVAFRGVAGHVVAQANCAEAMHNPPGGQPPEDQLYPDVTFTDRWSADVGDERVSARWYGRAHTSGDGVVTFERANVVHVGDLVFNRRHPVVDRPAGALMRNWAKILDQVAADHDADTLYVFGHAGAEYAVTGSRAELAQMRDYLGAVVAFVEKQVQAGRSREEIMAMREPLAGFEEYGPFGREGSRDPLTCAYDEVTSA
jgi:glyoxylase-like metal-dependent hydrolase (beta-lactamase superfamily II)